jgi:hypothetical protein
LKWYFDISDGKADWPNVHLRRSESGGWLKVDTCPEVELVGTNCVYAHEQIFRALKEESESAAQEQALAPYTNHAVSQDLRVCFDGSPLSYILRPSSRMRPGSIGLNALQRRNLASLGHSVLVKPLAVDVAVEPLVSIEFEIESAVPR